MVRPVISYPLTRKSFKVLIIFVGIFLCSYRFSWAVSLPAFRNESGYVRQSGNFVPGPDSDSDNFFSPTSCTQDSSRSAYLSYSGDKKLTALGLYFSYQGSNDVYGALQKVYLSLYLSNSSGAYGVLTPDTNKPLFSAPKSEDLQPDFAHMADQLETSFGPTYEVIFPIHGSDGDGLSLNPGSTFVAVIECRGLAEDDKLKIWERWSGSGQFIVMKARKNLSETPIYYYSSNNRLGYSLFKEHPSPEPYKPLVLLREAGRTNEVWDTLINELAYDKPSYVAPLVYDDNQNISALALKLQDEVAALSNLSYGDWGDGKVDLVGYGLGGLIAERYLRDHPTDHHVRRFVAVAVPFKGTPLLNWSGYTGTATRLGSWLNKKFLNGARDLLGANGGFNLGLTAVAQMADDNAYVQNKETGALPGDVAVYSVRGRLSATYTQTLFHFTVTRDEDLGDLFVPAESAQPAWIPAANQKIIPEAGSLNFTANLTRDSLGAQVEFFGPEIGSLTYLHGQLLNAPAVRTAIKSDLTGSN